MTNFISFPTYVLDQNIWRNLPGKCMQQAHLRQGRQAQNTTQSITSLLGGPTSAI